MLQGRTGYWKSRLEVEQLWDAREFASLEAKEFGEQVIDKPRIYFASG